MNRAPVTIQKNSTLSRLGKAGLNTPGIEDTRLLNARYTRLLNTRYTKLLNTRYTRLSSLLNKELERTPGEAAVSDEGQGAGLNQSCPLSKTNSRGVVVAGGGVVGLLNLTIRKKSAAAWVGYCGV